MRLKVVSVHFPKAAGTSLASGLRRHFGDALFLDYGHDPVNPDQSLAERPVLPPGTIAVHGHFRGDRYLQYSDAFRFTFLREPVSNLISIYYFWRSLPSQGHAVHDRFLAEQPSVVDFARHCWPIRRLMSVSYFGGIDLGAFDFVGFYETRQGDIARLSAQIGIPLCADVHHNKTSDAALDEREALMDDGPTLATLRTLLADDLAFYDVARGRWG